MSVYPRTTERKRIMQDYRGRHEEIPVGLSRQRPMSPKAQLEQEKKIRREIANSNERRRMQSINAGFQSLKTLLPHHAGEKLSKAAILQQTSEYIANLERDKTSLMAENDRLRQQLLNVSNTLNTINAAVAEESPPPKRKKRDTESSDEGIGLCEESSQLEEMRKKLVEIQVHLDQEKRMRVKFEERSKALEEKLQKLSNHVIDQETVMSLNEADAKQPAQPLFNSSMSRRNLQTIVEAIRHLEGENVAPFDEATSVPTAPSSVAESPAPPMAHQHSTPNIRSTSYLAPSHASEDSDKDNHSDSTETHDDCKSEASCDLLSPVEENDADRNDNDDNDSDLMRPVDFSTTTSYNPAPSSRTSSFSTTLSSSSSPSLTSSSPLSIEQRTIAPLQVTASDCSSSVVKANPSSCYKDNYLTTSLLHRSPTYMNQMYRRPGVIVHKS